MAVGSLAATESGFATFAVTVDSPLAAGIDQIVNNVTISDDGTNGPEQNTADNTATDTNTVQAAPDLYVSKDDGQAVVTAGQLVTYTIDYGNAGSQDATGVVLTETIPAGATFQAASSTVGWVETAPGSGVFQLNLGGLAADAMGTVIFSVTVDDPLAAGIDQLVNNISIADDGTNGLDEVPDDNMDSDTDTVLAAPDLVITKDDGGITTSPGGTVIYTLFYSNTGTQDATGVIIRETLPANTSFDPANSTSGWAETTPGSGIYEFSVGALDSGDSNTVLFAVTVDANVPAGFNLVQNTATISDDGTNGADEDPTNNTGNDNTPLATSVDLTLTVDDGVTTTAPGNVQVYAVDYQNVGDTDATGVVITQILPTGTRFDASNSSAGWVETSPGSGTFLMSLGTLPAGDMGSVNFAVVVDDPAAAGLDVIVNNASIADDGASGADPTPANNIDDDIDTLIAAPDLFVTKDDARSVVAAGDSLIYSINYGNRGSQDATGVVLTETLSAGVAFDAANSSAGWVETSPGSGVFNLFLGSVNAGQSATATFAVTVNNPLSAGIDQLVNDIVIADDGSNGVDETPADNQDNDTDTVTAAPDLVIIKDDGGASTTPGGTVIYTLNYSNTGSQDATGVVISETLPVNTTFDAANSTPGWTETAPGSGTYELNIGSLNSGDSGSVAFAVTVDLNVPAGFAFVSNNASIADDGMNGTDENPGDNSSSDTTPVDSSVDLVVTVDDGLTTTTPGNSQVYVVDYQNNGNITATGVVVTQTLPTGTSFDAANSSGGWVETAPGSGVFELTVGLLPAGGMGSANFAVTVDDPAAAGLDTIQAMATIADDGASGADPTPANNVDDDLDTLVAAPDLTISKDDGGISTTPGGTVVYTLTYSNVGSQHATGVFITEILPENTTFDAANSTPGWTQTAPGSRFFRLDLGDLDVGDSGSVDFAITVDASVPAGFDLVQNSASISNDLSNGLDEDISDNLASDDTPVDTQVDLILSVDDGLTITTPGSGHVYVVDYENVGNIEATGVVITQTLPTGTTFDAANSSVGWLETSPGSNVFQLDVGSLPAGSMGSVNFAVVIDNPAAAGLDTIVDLASITDDGASGVDPTPSNNVDDDIDTLVAAPDLVITKDDGGASVAPGGTIVYTLNYSNLGSQDATGVVITETLPANTTFDAANSTAGWVETAPGSGVFEFAVGSLNAGDSSSADFAVTVDATVPAGFTLVSNTASITDDGTNGPDEDPTDNSDTDTTPVNSSVDLVITVDDGLSTTTPGNLHVYAVDYQNVGDVAASGVVITQNLPAGTAFDAANSSAGWLETSPGSGVFQLNVGSLPAGGMGTVNFAITVDDPIAAGLDSIVDMVSITDDGTSGADPTPANNTDADTDVLVAAPDLFVTKDDAQSVVAAGDLVSYTINYGNDGSQGATGVVLTETLPAGVAFDAANSSSGWVETSPGSGVYTLSIGDLASGQMGSVTFAVSVDDPLAAGIDQLVNGVVISDDGLNGADEDPTDNQATDTDAVDAAPDLLISKDDGGISTTPGGTVIYTLSFSNIGSQDATGVVVSETLPANTSFNAASSSAGWNETSPGSGIYEFNVGALSSGASGSIDFAVTVNANVPAGFTLVTNSASITDDGTNGADENPADNTATDTTPVDSFVDLVLTIDDGLTTTVPGNIHIYVVDYQNVGDITATGVVITQTLPLGTSFDAANSSAGWIETGPGSGVFERSIGSLLAGEAGSVNFAVTVDDPAMAGLDSITDTASIRDDGANGADPTPANNLDNDVDTLVAAPNLFVTKDNAQSVVAAGDSISYTINYGNVGTQNATGVVLTETLPAGVVFDVANSSVGWTETAPGSGVFNLTIGDVASGQMGSATFAVTVDDPLAAGIDQLVNNVSITDDGSNGPDEDPTDNQDDDTDTVTAAPDLVIAKDDGGVSVAPGGTVVYTLTYSNVGSQDATGVVISETLPANTTFNAANSTAGWVETLPGSGIYEFSVGNLNAGDLATVDFAVTVDVVVPAGFNLVQNTASIADDGANGADENPGDNTGTDDTPLTSGLSPDLFVAKDDFRAVAFAGDGLVYSINYGNDGPVIATGVVLREALPAGTTFSPVNSTPGWTETSPGSGLFEFSVGTLNPMQTGVVQFGVTVDNPLAAGIEQIINNVEIFDDGANGPDADPSDNTATDTNVLDAAPDLYVSKDNGQSIAVAGDVLTYVIQYGNDGTQHASGVVLTETIPAGVTFHSAASTPGWNETTPGSGIFELSLGTVLANDSGSVTFAVTVDDPLAAGIDQLLNHVMIMDDGTNGPDQIPDDNEDTDTDTVLAAPDLVITKDDGGVSTTAGGTVIYTLSYSNVGSQDATGVVITENLPTNTAFDNANSTAGWTETAPGSGLYEFNLGAMPSGSSGTVEFAVTVNPTVPPGFTLVQNTAMIADDGTNGADEDSTNNSGTDTTPLTSGVDLVLTVDDGQTTAIPSDTLVYTLDYQNVGDATATGVVITETLPVGTTFDPSNSTAGWTETSPGSGVFEITVPAVPAAGTGSVQFAVTINNPAAAALDTIVNSASIADDGTSGADQNPSDNADNDIDTLLAAPDLYVTKDDGVSAVNAGDIVAYTITYGNDGSQDATGVVLTETLPLGVSFDAGNSSAGWTETSPGSGVYELIVGNLVSGQMGSVTFAVVVDDPLAAGISTLVNSVSIADDGSNGMDADPTDNQDTDTDTIDAAPDLVITKDDGGVSTVPGGTVVYTLSYSNVGSQDATSAFITEILPENTTFDPANSTPGWTETAPGSRFYRLDLGTLNVGDAGTVEFAVMVNTNLPAGFNLVQNSASISNDLANGLDEDISDNLASDDTPVVTNVDLVLTVDDGVTTTSPGAGLVYTLDYQNVGMATATGVVLTETLPTGTTFDSANSTPGWTETAPGSGIFELAIGSLNPSESGSVLFAVVVDDPVLGGLSSIINTASIADDGSQGADPTPSNNSDTDTDTLSLAPNLYVSKDDGRTVVSAGDSVSYSIMYGNRGSQDASGVVLSEVVPIGATFDATNSSLGWTETAPGSGIFELSVGNLMSGQMGSVTFAVIVNDPLAAGIDDLVNTIAIADDGTNGIDADLSDNQDTDTNTIDAAPDLVITKDDGGVSTVPGGMVVYTLNYSNIGSQDATGVFITEILPENTIFDPANSSLGWAPTAPGSRFYRIDLGALNSGDSGTVEFAVVVDTNLPAGFNLVQNSASISNDLANGLDEDISDNLASDDTPVLTDVDLVLTVDDGQTTTTPGAGLVYAIDYQNAGSVGATGVVITETLPVGTTFDPTNSTIGWTETAPGSGTFELNVGPLAAGESGTVSFAVMVDDPLAAGLDQLVNSVSIADDGASGPDATPTNNADDDVDTIAAAPDLYVTKDDGLTVVAAGNAVSYTVNFGNRGSQDATGVVLTETLPAGASFDAANSSAGWNETSPGSGIYDLLVGDLAAGASRSATFAVVVDNPLAAGIDDLVNSVSITDDGTNGADEDPTDNQANDTDSIGAAPDLVVTKDDGGSGVTPGGTVVYTISYSNIGSQDATGVVLTETLPANTTFDPTNSSAGWSETSPGSNVFTFGHGNLASGAAGTVDFAVTVDPVVPPGFTLVQNTVTISDDGTNGADEDPTNNSGTDDTPVVSAPDLTIAVDDGVISANTGDGLLYDIDYANVGNVDATGVVITETLPVGASFDAANSSAGWTETAPGSRVFELNVGTVLSGGVGSVQFAVTVDDPAATGVDSIVNQVAIADDAANGADPTPANNVDDDTDVLNAAPDLYVIKDDNQSVVAPGNRVSYAIAFGIGIWARKMPRVSSSRKRYPPVHRSIR